MSKWFDRNWYKYLFSERSCSDISWISVILCRIKNHPAGVIWYNPNGLEPDMRCKNCKDNLG